MLSQPLATVRSHGFSEILQGMVLNRTQRNLPVPQIQPQTSGTTKVMRWGWGEKELSKKSYLGSKTRFLNTDLILRTAHMRSTF